MGKISFITTVLNEEKTVGKLLVSIAKQTQKPDEIIIVDGGSNDGTIKIIQKSKFKNQNYNSKFKIIQKKGNRAVGRNEAIKQATGEIIVMSDAGCELDKRWVEEITKPFKNESFIRRPPAETLPPMSIGVRGRGDAFKTEVVAGYYQVSKEANIFERCVACYALVMPDKVDQKNFLPSSRSMAIRKSVFEKFGGFPEDFSDNEDYVLANRLKNNGAKIVFKKDAIVYWQPVSNLKDFFLMIFRFARGDAQAGLRRGKVATVFGRYALGLGIIWVMGIIWGIGLIGGYFLWAVFKNYKHSFSSNKYVKNWQAIFYLPVLQVTADLGVICGTIKGNYDQLRRSN